MTQNNKQLSVLVLTTSFPLYDGIAVGIHVLEKCRHLSNNGVNVRVLAPHHQGAKFKENIYNFIVIRFPYFFPLNFQRLSYGSGIPTNLQKSIFAKLQLPFFLISFFMHAIVMARKCDIIHCHWSIAGFIGVIIGKILKKKVVFMMHGAEVFVLGNNPVLRFVLKNVDYLISNSSFTEEKTLEVYPVVNHSIISPGVNLDRFFPQSRIINLREKINLPAEAFFILTIGKFIPRKGIKYLLEAMNIIINQRKYTDIYLRIGGRGLLRSTYERIIDELKIGSYVEFLGYIPDEDIPSFYSEADVFVLPSIVDERGDTEGLGVVFLEANACGTPVIGSYVGGIRDVIQDGINGFFIEQKNPEDIVDKILELYNDNAKGKEMGENGRLIVRKKFNWNFIAQRIGKVYQEIIENE